MSTVVTKTHLAKSYYRVNSIPNEVNIDISTFKHMFDPFENIYSGLVNSQLIENLNVNPSFIINKIICFVGYIETTLHLDSTSNFGVSRLDVEQLFFITLPQKSKFCYNLISFACDVRCRQGGQFYATLVLFDPDKVKQNNEDILWQSPMIDKSSINYWNCDYAHDKIKDKLVKFENLNIKLKNDKTYLVRIEFSAGGGGCSQVWSGSRDMTKTYFVNSNGQLYHNKYSMRGGDREGKMYELVLSAS